VLLSTGREFKGGKCIFYDLVVITEQDGAVVLIPHPTANAARTCFHS
jgi:hypothetical protein